ncbi:helix-turn-helix domain-containing protein [Niabella hibiscisoli]|uniref:helix-turn-helix domain-containing protein n=1 Tax=Niabella hibiscisoli TaxID=1825928 RepID=UPI001F11749D|nr:AraC family transcriptional regulator [Niabella hibiscisoli]MCH5717161.1 AraC family transcriptional regulator [Niabella hibiscisoli]
MKEQEDHQLRPGIFYSCYHQISRDGEHFVPEHTLSFVTAGSLILNDGTREYPSQEGRLRFIRRNQLLKFIKHPPANDTFKSISIYLSQEILKEFSLAHGVYAGGKVRKPGIVDLERNKSMETYMDSVIHYQEAGCLDNAYLVKVKIHEAILLLLQLHPELKEVLFEFTDPHKINLEAFMNRSYQFNVKLERFAYLTGRSLATFKRDFGKIFNIPPRQWLQKRRLQRAHYLITEEGKTASDIYLDLGFEDLTHFSHAFKREYGYSPKKAAGN